METRNRGTVVGRMQWTRIVCIAACVAVFGSPAKAESLAVGDVQAASELADEAIAVSLLVRTAFPHSVALTGTKTPTPADLVKLGVDHAVLLELARHKTGLGVTISIADRAGAIAVFEVHAGDGDVSSLADQVDTRIVDATHAERAPPLAQIGLVVLRPFAEAVRQEHDPASAIAALQDADPATAQIVTAITPALHDLVRAAPTAAAQMFVARAINARDLIDAFLNKDPKDGSPTSQLAAVVRAAAALDGTNTPAAEAALGKVTTPEANLVRAEIAEHRDNLPILNTLLADALKSPKQQRVALALASRIATNHLVAVKLTVLDLAERPTTSPWVAVRVGASAVESKVEVVRGLGLVHPRELTTATNLRVAAELAEHLDELPKATAARLTAELAMRRADGNEAAAIDAYLVAAPEDTRAQLYKALLEKEIKPPPKSTPAPVVLKPEAGSASPPVVAPIKHRPQKSEPESSLIDDLLTLPVLVGAGAVFLLLVILLVMVVKRRGARQVEQPREPPMIGLRIVVEAEPAAGIGVWTTDRRRRVITDAAGEASLDLPPGRHEIRFDFNGETFTRSVVIGTERTQRLVVDLRRSTGLASNADHIEPAARNVEPAIPDRRTEEATTPVTHTPPSIPPIETATLLGHADTATIDIPVDDPEPEPEPEPEPAPPPAKRASMFEVANPGTVPGHMPATLKTPAPAVAPVAKPEPPKQPSLTPTIKYNAPPPEPVRTPTPVPKPELIKPTPTPAPMAMPEPIKSKPEPVKPMAMPEPIKSTPTPPPMAKHPTPVPKAPPLVFSDAVEPPKAKQATPAPKAPEQPTKATGPTPAIKQTPVAKPLDSTRNTGSTPKLDPLAVAAAKSEVKPEVELDQGPFGATAGPAKRPSAPAKPAPKGSAAKRGLDTPMEFELSVAGAPLMALESELPVAPDYGLAPAGAPAANATPPVMDFEHEDSSSDTHAVDDDTRVKTAVRKQNESASEDLPTDMHKAAPAARTEDSVAAPPPVRPRTETGDLEDLPGEPTAITPMDLPESENTAPLAGDATSVTGMALGLDDLDDADDSGEPTSVSKQAPQGRHSEVHRPPAPAAAPVAPIQDTLSRPVGPPRLGGRYLRFNEIQRGPTGTVFRGYDERTKRDVGIEAMPPVVDPIASSSLVTALAKLEHDNLVRVFELVVHAGKPYLITEPLAGKSLDQHIIERGAYPWLEAVGLMDEVCKGLEYAHERSILHRAIRPGVIVLQGKTPKLGGFAIAPDLDDPSHIAPEVVGGARPDKRSDIYAIGATLFQCLTGRAPTDKHALPKVPLKLQILVDTMLSKLPADRPSTVAEVRDSFKNLLDF